MCAFNLKSKLAMRKRKTVDYGWSFYTKRVVRESEQIEIGCSDLSFHCIECALYKSKRLLWCCMMWTCLFCFFGKTMIITFWIALCNNKLIRHEWQGSGCTNDCISISQIDIMALHRFCELVLLLILRLNMYV
jgi:hypothetical protein